MNELLCVQLAGVREGDVIIGIGGRDVKWSSHEQVVAAIKAAKNVLSLNLIFPVEKPAPKVRRVLVFSILRLSDWIRFASTRRVIVCGSGRFHVESGLTFFLFVFSSFLVLKTSRFRLSNALCLSDTSVLKLFVCELYFCFLVVVF